jgi:hypothetical protein
MHHCFSCFVCLNHSCALTQSPHLTLRELNKLLVATGTGSLQKKIVGVRSLRLISENSLEVLEHWPSGGEVMSEVVTSVHNELGVALLTTGKGDGTLSR